MKKLIFIYPGPFIIRGSSPNFAEDWVYKPESFGFDIEVLKFILRELKPRHLLSHK